MKNIKYILIILACFSLSSTFAQCGPTTPSFTCNLVGQPNGTWTSPSIVRADTCCGATAPDKCLKFTIILDPLAVGINFIIASGAVPPGALYYQINCGPLIPVGSPICLNGPGPHILTFCKPGNNNNTYAITSIPAPVVPDSVMVRSGCSVTVAVSGFSVPTLNWTSVNPGPNGLYNPYLSCVSGCATVVVTPTGTPPPFVDYQVSGFAASPCQASFYIDTVRVYFYNDLLAGINPTLSTICFGQSNAVLTCTASGGLPAYTYSWSNGSTVPTVSVGPGTYTCIVGDITGCPPTTATAIVNSFSLPISANAGPDQTTCKTSPNTVLNGTIVMASGGIWSGGSGTITPSPTSLSITYIPTPAELTAGSVQLTLTSTGNAGCPGSSDVVLITYQNPPVASAGPGSTVCANNNLVSLNGSITGYSSTPQWSGSGSGVFTSTSNLSTTYTPSGADISAGFVNFTLTTLNNGVCPAASATVQVIITPAPVVAAGASQTICSANPAVLNGTVAGATNTGSWSTNGDGIFNPSPNQVSTNYVPGPNDIAAGSVTLFLTSTGNGNCFAATNSLVITIKQIATVNAGPSQSICSTQSTINISGNVSGGTSTGVWATSGSGAFNPGVSFLNNIYMVTGSDITAGTVMFTLSSTNNGPCPVVSSTLSLSISPLATVSAGPNQLLCANAGTVSLNGTVSNTLGMWASSGPGPFNPNVFNLNPTYSITPTDILAGSMIFTLTSLNNGVCPTVQDTVKISLKNLATVNAGTSQVICSTQSTININGLVGGGTSTGIWSTNGSGVFNPSAAFLNNNYFVSISDIGLGSLIFTLTSSNNGPCPAVTDTLMLTIIQLASVNAGLNQILCSNAGTIALNGNINTGNGVWASSGSGTYSPDNLNLSPTYSMSANDMNAGFVTFTLSSANNGPCPIVNDSLKITIRKLNTVNAGPDKSICSTSTNVAITGSVSGGSSTGIWSSLGGGNFSPGNTTLSTSYNISGQDLNSGNAVLILTSSNNGVCPAVKDTLNIKIYKNPSIRLSSDTAICIYQNPLKIHPNVSGDFGYLQWNSSGSGLFLPTNLGNPVTYDFAHDILPGALSYVTLSITALNNGPCGNVNASIKVAIRPAPTAEFSPSTYTANIPNDPITFKNLSTSANSYYWDFGDGGFSNQVNPIHNYLAVGYYTVNLVSYNNYGCSDTAVKDILVRSDIQFPNVFTPNTRGANGGEYNVNDYSNDVFFPYTAGVTQYNLKIFNRWGELIFESNDIKTGWNGYFKDKLCQQDAYVWKADVKFFDGRTYNKTGSVTLLR